MTASHSTEAMGQTAEELAENPPAVWEVGRNVKIGELKDAYLIRADPLTFKPDGESTSIVAPALGNTARIYNAVGDVGSTLAGHTARVTIAKYSPDGKLVVTVADDQTVRIWDAESATEQHRFDHWKSRLPDENAGRLVDDAHFSPDSKQLLTISKQLGIDLWDIDSETARPCGRGGIARFSPDGKRIAIADASTLRVLETEALTTLFEVGPRQ